MLIVHVQVHVKSESVAAFIEATIENARKSIQEPGIVRFDWLSKRMILPDLCWWKSIKTRRRRWRTKKPRTIPNGAMPWPR